MKKTLIAVFSVSITAGTVYLGYSHLKSVQVRKLIKSWREEMKKRNAELSEDQVQQLNKELDKLNLWEVKQLAAYSEKAIQQDPEKELSQLLNKLRQKKIFEKADLKPVEAILITKGSDLTITNS